MGKVWYNDNVTVEGVTERGGRMTAGLTFIMSMITKVALVLIAAGLIWYIGRELWEKYHRPKE